DRGEVRIFNQNVNSLSDDEKSNIRLNKIGFVFQFFNLIPTLTALRLLLFQEIMILELIALLEK
ncbi:MAG: ABC transporter ATP-binding protein, partial [Nitrososphaeria archaeon]